MEISTIKPTLNLIRPIMDEVPEIADNKHVVTRLIGGIELNNVSFRYNEHMPDVLHRLNLKINPGQYVAIVGKTGCGKSTLMRIMLGFERPQKGAVYYDGRDLSTLDLKSLRRNIGTVMQNSRLFSGDIYSNITISAPQLSEKQAWEAAEMAGVAEDIKRMPMGMHTLISEGSGAPVPDTAELQKRMQELKKEAEPKGWMYRHQYAAVRFQPEPDPYNPVPWRTAQSYTDIPLYSLGS